MMARQSKSSDCGAPPGPAIALRACDGSSCNRNGPELLRDLAQYALQNWPGRHSVGVLLQHERGAGIPSWRKPEEVCDRHPNRAASPPRVDATCMLPSEPARQINRLRHNDRRRGEIRVSLRANECRLETGPAMRMAWPHLPPSNNDTFPASLAVCRPSMALASPASARPAVSAKR